MRRILLILMMVLSMGCAPSMAIPATAPPTATTIRIVQASPLPAGAPTANREVRLIDTLPPPTLEPTQAACAESAIPSHRVDAQIDYAARRVDVTQQTRFVNMTGAAQSIIVFSVEPNRYPGIFTLFNVTAAAPTVRASELTGRRLTVELDAPLAVGCALTLTLQFQLNITPVGEVLSATSGYLGYSQRQFNLGLWLPAVAPYRDGRWITHDAALVGEQTLFEVANWDIAVHMTSAPPDLVLAAPGVVAQIDAERWRIRHENARDVSLSFGVNYQVERVIAEDGTLIEAYTFPDAMVNNDNATVNGGAHMLETAARSLAMYSDLFGAYPHERFVIIQADFRDGMEFHGLAFVGGEWFRTFPGTPASYLTIITVHEVAHQWWYARVGSDQALAPWLDEALATYSEYIYYEEYHPDLREWWWSFRIDAFLNTSAVSQPVDSTVYVFSSAREYINAVYLRGARMLHDLRRDLGTDAFINWLRAYAESGENDLVGAEALWGLLTPLQSNAAAATRARYLSEG